MLFNYLFCGFSPSSKVLSHLIISVPLQYLQIHRLGPAHAIIFGFSAGTKIQSLVLANLSMKSTQYAPKTFSKTFRIIINSNAYCTFALLNPSPLCKHLRLQYLEKSSERTETVRHFKLYVIVFFNNCFTIINFFSLILPFSYYFYTCVSGFRTSQIQRHFVFLVPS